MAMIVVDEKNDWNILMKYSRANVDRDYTFQNKTFINFPQFAGMSRKNFFEMDDQPCCCWSTVILGTAHLLLSSPFMVWQSCLWHACSIVTSSRRGPVLIFGVSRDFGTSPKFRGTWKPSIIPVNSWACSGAGGEDRVTWLDLQPG